MADKIKIILGGSEGNMGKVIQKLINETDDFEIFAKIDPKGWGAISSGLFRHAEEFFNGRIFFNGRMDIPEGLVYVDFTTPQAVIGNVKAMSQGGVDSVIGTTGWYDKLPDVKAITKKHGRIILYPQGNFSVGANAFLWATEQLAEKLGRYGFDAALLELHHKGKKDSPSGTAEMAGRGLLKLPGKKKLTYARSGKDAKRGDEEVDVFGARVGSVTGYHMVVFSPNAGDYERLTIEHNASNRDVFGRPALEAVRWVYNARRNGMEPGLYEFRRDILKL